MIIEFTPFSFEKNLGKAYNECASLVQDDQTWILFSDSDVAWLTPNYMIQLRDMIKLYPETGLFTCLTNRIGNLDQCYNGEISENADMRYHEELAIKLQKENYHGFKSYNKIISGHVMLFKKSTWNQVKFDEIPGKILSIDNHFSYNILKKGFDIKILTGVYCFHKYRLIQGKSNKSHLL